MDSIVGLALSRELGEGLGVEVPALNLRNTSNSAQLSVGYRGSSAILDEPRSPATLGCSAGVHEDAPCVRGRHCRGRPKIGRSPDGLRVICVPQHLWRGAHGRSNIRANHARFS